MFLDASFEWEVFGLIDISRSPERLRDAKNSWNLFWARLILSRTAS